MGKYRAQAIKISSANYGSTKVRRVIQRFPPSQRAHHVKGLHLAISRGANRKDRPRQMNGLVPQLQTPR